MKLLFQKPKEENIQKYDYETDKTHALRKAFEFFLLVGSKNWKNEKLVRDSQVHTQKYAHNPIQSTDTNKNAYTQTYTYANMHTQKHA